MMLCTKNSIDFSLDFGFLLLITVIIIIIKHMTAVHYILLLWVVDGYFIMVHFASVLRIFIIMGRCLTKQIFN